VIGTPSPQPPPHNHPLPVHPLTPLTPTRPRTHSLTHPLTATQALSAEIDALKRREKRFNKDVAVINREVDTFHASPAFKMARKHVLENFVEQVHTVMPLVPDLF
jgi:hypothetical protein